MYIKIGYDNLYLNILSYIPLSSIYNYISESPSCGVFSCQFSRNAFDRYMHDQYHSTQ